MRYCATSATGTAFKQMNISWTNWVGDAKLTDAWFVYGTTHVHPTRFSIYYSGWANLDNEFNLFKRFCDTATTSVSYYWQPEHPITIQRGDVVRMYCTAAVSSVSYMAGFNIEV